MFSKKFVTFFDGEPATPETPEGADPNANSNPLEGGDPKKSFTQDEVNKIIATERKKHEERTKKSVADLETLKKSKSLTDAEKATLQSKIDELQTSLMTKEELAKKEQSKLLNQHKKEVESISGERDTWRDRFTTNEILRTISDAAHANKAFNPNQIIAILRPITTLKEVTTEDGSPTGVFEPRVKYPDTDKEGKKVTLDLTVPEAVKRMKEMTDVYGNLFTETAAGGLGMSGGTAPKGPVDFKNMSIEQYLKQRESLGLQSSNK